MLLHLIMLNFSLAALQKRDDLVCNDPEIKDQCLAECRLDYLDCRENCDSEFCSTACQAEFQGCEGSCPCSFDCPTGCSDCPEHPLCGLPIDPEEVFILVITDRLSYSYLASGDGSSQIEAKINAPSDDYTEYARHAILYGNIYIFGGSSDPHKIATLEDCTLKELSERLNDERRDNHAALSIENGTAVLICFGERERSCEIFSGSEIILLWSTTEWHHDAGGLGMYKDQPTTVGCEHCRGSNKTETLSSYIWTSLSDFPIDIWEHSLVSLDDKSMLLLGGYGYSPSLGLQSGIWQLQDDRWSKIGVLSQPTRRGSAIYIGKHIYFFGGSPAPYPIQKIDMNDNEEIQKVEVIGNQSGDYWTPTLFQTTSDYCV